MNLDDKEQGEVVGLIERTVSENYDVLKEPLRFN